MKIEIPFNEWSKSRLETGMKCATSRTKRYGEEGDTFIVGGWEYIIIHIVKVPLRFVAEVLYDSEGAESMEEFVKVWEEIHPRKGYVSEQMVWYHYFSIYNKLGEQGNDTN